MAKPSLRLGARAQEARAPRSGQAERAAAGFTVKSGWACAVLIGGTRSSPRLIDSRRIEISDPEIPDAKQPYHAGFGTARDAGDELRRLVASVKTYGRKSMSSLIREYQKAANVKAAGVVVGSLIDPTTIGNDHIRIHAMEGKLFREVLIDGAERSGIGCSVWRERDLYGVAGKRLKATETVLRKKLTALGDSATDGWRAEHKAAALAAWMVL
jgi:hypothetical protein